MSSATEDRHPVTEDKGLNSALRIQHHDHWSRPPQATTLAASLSSAADEVTERKM